MAERTILDKDELKATPTRVRADANPLLAGDITIATGTNITLTQVGQTITITAYGMSMYGALVMEETPAGVIPTNLDRTITVV